MGRGRRNGALIVVAEIHCQMASAARPVTERASGAAGPPPLDNDSWGSLLRQLHTGGGVGRRHSGKGQTSRLGPDREASTGHRWERREKVSARGVCARSAITVQPNWRNRHRRTCAVRFLAPFIDLRPQYHGDAALPAVTTRSRRPLTAPARLRLHRAGPLQRNRIMGVQHLPGH